MLAAAVKKRTKPVASSSLKWKVGMRSLTQGRRFLPSAASPIGSFKKEKSQPGCTFQPSPFKMGGA